ncbi:MAG: ribosomal protein S18-alanine N-acetyltransferase [Limnochordaceae bacterium]|nr:ribosomal protein S18-alanine N-acetyltransferase [Limnochordaceae bacterium]
MHRGPLDVTVDPMRVRDLNDIMVIERLSFSTPWSKSAFLSELLENERAHYLVARADGRAVGYVGIWLVADEGHITNVAVHPEYRSRGVGRKLMEAITELARRKGARRLTLEVRKSNLRAQRLYESLGFQGVGLRKGYYRDNNEDAIIMWRELSEGTGPGA